ncbi:unnamed protein product [Agarophyton chilense]
MAAGVISTRLAEWLLVALIVVSLIFEAILHRIEHWINHKHQHLKAVTWVLYRELMILGLVSFTFILYETIKKPEGSTILSFEFAHVFIFLLAIFYTVVLVCSMIASLRMSKRWKEMERIDLVRYLHLKDKYSRFRTKIHRHKGSYWQLFQWWFPNFKKLFQYWDLHELMAFHDIRFQVIYYRNLPEHFRFASFLRRIKASTFLELVETHWSLWVILLVLVLADIVRRYITRSGDEILETTKFILRAGADAKKKDYPPYKPDPVESGFIIAGALILLIFCQVLSTKIRHIYWELTKHPRVYYNNVEPHILDEELSAAVEQRRSVRSRPNGKGDQSYENGALADDEDTDFGGNLSPQWEMLAPMNHEPVSGPISTGAVAKGKDSTEGKPNDRDGAISEISAADTFASDRGALRYASARRTEVLSKTQASPSGDISSSVDRQAKPPSRSSIEYRRTVRSDLSANAISDGESRVSLEQPPLMRSRDDSGDDGSHGGPHGLPLELHETARRHSLDLTRAPAVVAPVALASNMRPTSVAHAAVHAARRRSLEGNPLAQGAMVETGRGGGSRSSLEIDRDDSNRRRSLNNTRVLSQLSSRRSVDDENSRVSLGFRNSLDSGSRRRSIELARAMPHDELHERHHATSPDVSDIDGRTGMVQLRRGGSLDGEKGDWDRVTLSSVDKRSQGKKVDEDDDGSGTQSSRQQNSFLRAKPLAKLNATILSNLEVQEQARNTEPAYYPWIIRKLIPRLGRVASPVEKLFWFGSHQFYLYCVEFTLFFSTVLVAAAFASLSLLLLYDRVITGVNIASFVLPPITLAFVLLRIAGIIKKYIFIIHNASLVPEAVAIKAIHTATRKGPVVSSFDDSEASGDDTEVEDEESGRERRRKLGRYFRTEAEMGHLDGIDGEEATRLSDAGSASQRRAKKRSLLMKLRSRRSDPFAEDAAQLPV